MKRRTRRTERLFFGFPLQCSDCSRCDSVAQIPVATVVLGMRLAELMLQQQWYSYQGVKQAEVSFRLSLGRSRFAPLPPLLDLPEKCPDKRYG